MFQKPTLTALVSTIGLALLAACSGNEAPKTADSQTGFRLGSAEMHDIASANKLPHRVFYTKPSTGEHAAWFDAVKRGDLGSMKQMVANGQNIEAQDTGSLNQTALGWAACIGYEDVVDYLLAQGASLQATDKGDVYNVLKSAVLGKNANVVRKIHQRMPNVDLNDQSLESDGETLVMVAASNNRIAVVKYLLAQGANVNLSTTTQDTNMGSYDQSPLTYACKRGHVDMQQLLIANGALNHRTGKPACD